MSENSSAALPCLHGQRGRPVHPPPNSKRPSTGLVWICGHSLSKSCSSDRASAPPFHWFRLPQIHPGFTFSRFHRFMDSRIHGFTDSRFQDSGFRIPGDSRFHKPNLATAPRDSPPGPEYSRILPRSDSVSASRTGLVTSPQAPRRPRKVASYSRASERPWPIPTRGARPNAVARCPRRPRHAGHCH